MVDFAWFFKLVPWFNGSLYDLCRISHQPLHINTDRGWILLHAPWCYNSNLPSERRIILGAYWISEYDCVTTATGNAPKFRLPVTYTTHQLPEVGDFGRYLIENSNQMPATRYCSGVVEATVAVNTPNGDTSETTTHLLELRSFAEVVAHLQAVRDQQLTLIADAIANGLADRNDYLNIGGFTCELHNAFGGVVEFALSPNYSLMMRKAPKPFTWYRNGPDSDDILVFYIDGGHYTEFSLRELASRDSGLEKLERWLNAGEFPESVR